MYKKINDSNGNESCIQRLADSAFIPFDPANLAWLAEGNTPLPAE